MKGKKHFWVNSLGETALGADMPLDSKNVEITIGGNFSDAWILPSALLQLEESGEILLVDELIEIFQTDTAERLEVLGRAVESADHVTVGHEAHTIKGSASQVGAVRVADVCRQMEMEARKPQPVALAALYRILLNCFDEVRGVIAVRRPASAGGSLQHGQ